MSHIRVTASADGVHFSVCRDGVLVGAIRLEHGRYKATPLGGRPLRFPLRGRGQGLHLPASGEGLRIE